MGAFLLIRRDRIEREPRMVEYLRKELIGQGFAEPREISHPRFTALVFAKFEAKPGAKLDAPAANLHYDGPDRFAFATGTLIYDDKVGVPALAQLLEDFTPGGIDWSRLAGHFCLCVARDGEAHLLVDRLGVYKAYRDSAGEIISSSFLATLASLRAPAIDTQAVYEYVFQGATYGDDTVIEQIKLVDCGGMIRVSGDAEFVAHSERIVPGVRAGPIDEHLERSLANLRTYYARLARLFGGRIDTALSGGYDSRLALALLREQGVTPRLHVYGSPGDADVRVATHIAQAEGLDLETIDKGTMATPGADAFPEIVERNFRAFDGYPTDGIFDNGSDLATRRDRCGGGELMLNGGGGEVFRNFFYLRDARFTLRQFLWSFYNRYDPAACTDAFSERSYLGALGEKVCATLGRGNGVLERGEIEFLYPCFRCRYWMGRNNSVNSRLGHALTPFVDHAIVEDAISIPLEYKTHGIFEGRLIRAVSPALARYPSVYGHDFAADPPVRRRLADWGTLARPALLRRYVYRLKQRTGKGRAFPAALSRACLENMIDPEFPFMSRYFRVGRVADAEQFTRIATLEYLFERCGL